jgi:hypothetical protein
MLLKISPVNRKVFINKQTGGFSYEKFFKSKGFIVTSLAVLCITILGVCWYAGQDKSDPFLPDESPPASTESTWSENNILEFCIVVTGQLNPLSDSRI